MDMIRGLRINTISLSFTAALLVSSCVPVQQSTSEKRTDGIVDNSANTVNPAYGRVIMTNPVVQTGKYNLPFVENMAKYLQREPVLINDDQFLTLNCRPGLTGQQLDCFKVLNKQSDPDLQSSSHKWAFATDTDSFLQVQGYYHIKKMINQLQSDFESFYNSSQSASYNTSIPVGLFSSGANWYPGHQLVAYTNCGVEDNSYYNPSTFSLCFGQVSKFPSAKFAFDPSVIYHETGHAFTQMMLNVRNVSSGLTERIDLGSMQYDEPSAINEGISDFFSYYMTKRTHFAEWALGLFYGQSRPMSEDDDLHAPGIATTADARLSYPQYINYDPNDLKNVYEAVHYTGQIASHFFLALTRELEDYCGMTEERAARYVLYFINETLAEKGDLSTYGADSFTQAGNYNLNSDSASLWALAVNPPNYYNFFQSFSKFALGILDKDKQCNGISYPKDRLENLLDQYGLLLFKTYNENGNSVAIGHNGAITRVEETNRLQSVLVSKNNVMIDQRTGAIEAYVFDNRTTIINAIAAMKQSGQITEISPILTEQALYNNNNARISPGEIIGLALNLYNNSNSTIAGVQVLANDWDHTKVLERNASGTVVKEQLCKLSDGFPLEEEGGADDSLLPQVAGQCNYITRDNGATNTDPVSPVCFVQSEESGAAVWVPQWKLRSKMQLPARFCLSGEDKTDDCFIRAIKGADQATFSKIDGKKNWAETITLGLSGSPKWNYSNFLFFEVSPHIPPGTTFNCRLRARFTNCKDCFYDSTNLDDFLDYEYSGEKPFKIINFKFIITD